jgi:hypothetical protein
MTFAAIYSFRVARNTLNSPAEELARYTRVLGPDRMQMALRHEAAEMNRALFEVWGYAQVALSLFVFGMFLFATREGKYALGTSGLLLLLVCAMAFYITPNIIAYGRPLDFVPADQQLSLRQKVAVFHNAYSVVEVIKLLLISSLAVLLLRERRGNGRRA